MFEVININLGDKRELDARLKKIKEKAPDADVRFDQKISRYYICLGEYGELSIAQRNAKEFRKKGLVAGVKVD